MPDPGRKGLAPQHEILKPVLQLFSNQKLKNCKLAKNCLFFEKEFVQLTIKKLFPCRFCRGYQSNLKITVFYLRVSPYYNAYRYLEKFITGGIRGTGYGTRSVIVENIAVQVETVPLKAMRTSFRELTVQSSGSLVTYGYNPR
jgi:hypothetical protein